MLATVGFSHASLAITCATVVRIGDSGGDGPSTAREVLPNHEIYKTENRLYLLSESDEGVLMITGLKLPFGSLAENRFGAPYFAGAA